ncbi:Uncharacterized conserved protein, contains GH25 family domain [Duganella sacchari]|uniref:Uncharacterized conserved protein, contains GH25 family domain n=1 Tax=Duganella sacchari TaxID=551987 RepID=A0A1M7IL63_9BURK|nr:DUF4198 domain-containing protein [Duganella sacchari]SHM41343.1 Uncharacterized conserved protein, contains GH25 family domain [Duganella sacchari]
MNLQKTLIALALTGMSLVSLSAQAHKPWLLPSSTQVEAGRDGNAWVTVDAAISEGLFDIDHQPLKLDGIDITGPDGAKLAPENVNNGKLRNTFDLKLVKTGTYKIALVSQSVFGSYKDKEGNVKRFRGTEESLAKDVPADASEVKLSRTESRLETFVSNGDASKEVLKPTGKGLELVAVTHPTELRAGEKATFRFLLDGKPAANQGVSLIPGGVKYRGTLGEIRKTTDANGELTLVLPAAGAYMVSSSWPAAAPQAPGQPPQMPPRRATYAAIVDILPE